MRVCRDILHCRTSATAASGWTWAASPRCGADERQRDAMAVHPQIALAALLPPVHRFGPVHSPPSGVLPLSPSLRSFEVAAHRSLCRLEFAASGYSPLPSKGSLVILTLSEAKRKGKDDSVWEECE